MSDWSHNQALPPLFLNTWDGYSVHGMVGAWEAAASPTALTWVANHCVYMPVTIPWDYPVNRVFWCNGSTASSNAAFAIYARNAAGGMAQIYTTGSVAQSGTSVPQFTTPSPTFILPAGNYYFAVSNSGTTSRMHGTTNHTVDELRMVGVLQQGTAHPPPSPATPVATTQALYALCGVTFTTTGY